MCSPDGAEVSLGLVKMQITVITLHVYTNVHTQTCMLINIPTHTHNPQSTHTLLHTLSHTLMHTHKCMHMQTHRHTHTDSRCKHRQWTHDTRKLDFFFIQSTKFRWISWLFKHQATLKYCLFHLGNDNGQFI